MALHTYSDSDLEAFEDEPVAYFRRDLEGGDSESSRRKAVLELVRDLRVNFEAQMRQFFQAFIGPLIQGFADDPARWRDKNTLIYLLTSPIVQTLVTQAFDVSDFFQRQLMNDLDLNGKQHAIVKVDALRYIVAFRASLNKQLLLSLVPRVIGLLSSTNFCLYSYAAVCLEKIVMMSREKNATVTQTDLQPFFDAAVAALLSRVDHEQSGVVQLHDNEQVIRALLCTLLVMRDHCAKYAPVVLQKLHAVLQRLSQNPANPKYNHTLFECISVLIK